VEAHERAPISLSSYEFLFVVPLLFTKPKNQPVPFSHPADSFKVVLILGDNRVDSLLQHTGGDESAPKKAGESLLQAQRL